MGRTSDDKRREFTWLFWACALALLLVAVELGRSYYFGALQIRVEGNLSPQERAELDTLLDPYVRTSAFWLDSEAFVRDVGSLPWVGAVEVRPTGLSRATVKVSRSLAERLSRPERTLVNTLRDLASSNAGSALTLSRETLNLEASGRDSPSTREFVFLAFDVMLDELGIRLDAIEIGPSGHISLHMDAGKTLLLGRSDPLARTQRFARIFQSSLAPQWDRVGHVDARYADAVAVRMSAAGQLVAGNFDTRSGDGR